MRLFVHDITMKKSHKDVRGLRRATRYRRDWEVREAACDALGKLGGTHAVRPLVAALRDEYWPVREAAATALGGIGDTCAVEPLIVALRAEDTQQAGAAVPVRFGHPEFSGLHDRWTLRRAIVIALGQLGDARAVAPLVATLRDDRKWVRGYAAEALGKLGDPRAVDPLIAVLTDEDSFVRATAAKALDRLAWRPDDGAAGAAGAAYWVATKQWVKCVKTGVIAPLLAVLNDDDPAIHCVVVDTLAGIGARAVEPLMDVLNDPHTTWRGRSGAAEALGRIGDPRALEALIAALPNAASATALGKLGDARAVEPLLTVLNDREISVRRAAAQSLGQLGDTRAVKPLISAMSDHDEGVRTAAAESLDQLAWRPKGTPAAPTYWVVTHQWDKAVHIAAVEPLIMALQDHEASVREPAARALGMIGDARAIEPLSHALGDQDIDVAKAAARALVAMYSSGKLDEAQKARVLALRARITFQDDVPEHEGVDVRDDRSIGVDFPI